jgi:hypothetical protein
MKAAKTLAILAAAASLAAAGCSGRGGASAQGAPTAEKREQAMLEFAECMRSHGIDVPDPTTDDNGNLVMRGPGRISPAARAAPDSKERAAQQECRKHLEGSFQQFSPEQRAEMQDRMVKFAECMRSKGIEMPDPDFSQAQGAGEFRQRIRSGGVNVNDEKFREASDACREKVFAGQAGPGGGRGGMIFAPPGGRDR